MSMLSQKLAEKAGGNTIDTAELHRRLIQPDRSEKNPVELPSLTVKPSLG